MQEAIANIATYIDDMDYTTFLNNRLVQDAVLRNLEIIGEAAGKVRQQDPDFSTRHPAFPIAEAYGLRNWISHGYFKIDMDVIWETIERDLPELQRQIEHVLHMDD
jgi:uncharacterized protein with HEPN domain